MNTADYFKGLLGTISKDGVELELGSGLNFTGDVTVTPNALTGKIDIAISGAGGSRHAIQDDGTPLSDQPTIDFTGGGVTATASAGKITVAIPGAPAISPGGAPADVDTTAAAAGAASTYARSDHKHDITTAAPGSVNLAGVAASEGTAAGVARADHVHSLTGTLPMASGGTGLSAAALGRMMLGTGTAWQAYGPPSQAIAADASVTKQLSDGSRFFVDDSALTVDRTITMGTTGATEGRVVNFICTTDGGADNFTLDWGAGTMLINSNRWIDLRYTTGAGWELSGWQPLA